MPERHKAHVSHCLDILLQALTCQPSLDVIHHQWMKTQMNPYPDFNIKRQCVKHSAILKWQSSVGLTKMFATHEMRKPPDAKEVEAEPSLLVIGDDLGS